MAYGIRRRAPKVNFGGAGGSLATQAYRAREAAGRAFAMGTVA